MISDAEIKREVESLAGRTIKSAELFQKKADDDDFLVLTFTDGTTAVVSGVHHNNRTGGVQVDPNADGDYLAYIEARRRTGK